jgi:hypothetical protein
LNWALAGFVKLPAEFKETGDFKLTDTQDGRVNSFPAEIDSLRIFVKERSQHPCKRSDVLLLPKHNPKTINGIIFSFRPNPVIRVRL